VIVAFASPAGQLDTASRHVRNLAGSSPAERIGALRPHEITVIK
jgi:hypothetical protein